MCVFVCVCVCAFFQFSRHEFATSWTQRRRCQRTAAFRVNAAATLWATIWVQVCVCVCVCVCEVCWCDFVFDARFRHLVNPQESPEDQRKSRYSIFKKCWHMLGIPFPPNALTYQLNRPAQELERLHVPIIIEPNLSCTFVIALQTSQRR